MLLDAELAGMRTTSASALPDTGTVTRPVSGGTLDPNLGTWVPDAATAIYDGTMRVRPPTANESTILFGDESATRQRFVATLPHDAAVVSIDDRLTVTSSSDPQMDDRQFRVVSVSAGSFHIDRRLGLEVVE